jgi:hypothetical protein
MSPIAEAKNGGVVLISDPHHYLLLSIIILIDKQGVMFIIYPE